MREIKFRAWDTAQKMMVGVTDMEFYEGKLGWISAASFDDETKSQNDGDPSYLIPMQYTGLRDQNGKEIYEGDIVRYTAWHEGEPTSVFQGEVVYGGDLGMASFNIRLDHDDEIDRAEVPASDAEIMGNVFENPELLEAHDDN